jgi:transposase
MSYNFLPYNQDQLFLLPPALNEWVAEDSLVRFVSDVVDHLDGQGRLDPFYARYREDGWGHPAYHPVMLVKVLLYGYAVGVRSSRKLARALFENVAFRYLAANQQPDFRTLADFRKRHGAELEALFIDVLELCREAGLVKLGRVALDGRRVRANASLSRNRTREQIAREVREILAEAERVDQDEDARYGEEGRGDELPEELRRREDRLRKLKQARARLEAEEARLRAERAERIRRREEEERRRGRKLRGRKLKPPEAIALREDRKANLTDPDSGVQSTYYGWIQGYNGQVMVDCSSQVIVAVGVTSTPNDFHQLAPMLRRCEEVNGRKPRLVVADAGYWSEENAALEDEETELFLATANERTLFRGAKRAPPSPRDRAASKPRLRDRMERKLRTERGRRIYRERSQTVEPVFGQMYARCLNDFLLRGLAKVRMEWSLFCTTHNLLKLWRSGWTPAVPAG